ncbi:hypothetical protein sos41_32320 [Alphaproteobacteria bacterium SO-S41]|nr:hypothetical protein sos41_32320 [Alphaproteobacteria bacterium SO-S41]
MSYRFAALTSGLLARKGSAQPAMTSHAGGNPRAYHDELPPLHVPVAAQPITPAPEPFRPATTLSKAGYTFDATPAAAPATVTPQPVARMVPPPPRAVPPVMARAAEAAVAAGCSTTGACAVSDPTAADPARRFHISVRLRQAHFVRLKIASAQLRKPSQDIVGDALTAYFRTLDPAVFGDCACARE